MSVAILAMLVAARTAAAYSALGFADVSNGNVGLHEFLGRHAQSPKKSTPDIFERITTVADAEPVWGGTGIDGINAEEIIVKDIKDLLQKLDQMNENADEMTAKSNGEEGHANILINIGPTNTSKTLDSGTSIQDDTPISLNRNGASMFTFKHTDTATEMFKHTETATEMLKNTDTATKTLNEINVHADTREKLDNQPQTMASSLGQNGKRPITFEAQINTHRNQDNEKSVTDDTSLPGKTIANFTPLETETSNDNTQNIRLLTVNANGNIPDVEILHGGVFKYGKEYNTEKSTNELEAETLRNDEQTIQKGFTETMPTNTPFSVADVVVEVSQGSPVNKTFFNKKQNAATNKIDKFEDKNYFILTTAETSTSKTIRHTGHSEEQPIKTYQNNTRRTEEAETLSLLDTWLSIVNKVGEIEAVPEPDTATTQDNATEESHLQEEFVSNNTIRAVKEVLSSRNLAIVVERSEDTLQQADAILHSVVDNEGASDGQLLLVTYAEKVSAAAQCGRAELPGLVGRQRASGGPRWATLEAVLEAARRTPPGGGVLVLAASRPSDERLAYSATRALRDKRLKLYVVWCGPRSTGDEGSLRDLSWYSGGTFLVSDNSSAAARHPHRMATLTMRRELSRSSDVAIPVDSTLHAVHFTTQGPIAQGPVTTAVLYDPTGVTFQRISYLTQETTADTVSPMELELGINSTLSALPGQTAQLIFTVTNNQEQTSYIDFRCSSQHFSINVQPQSFQIAAHQTVHVLATVAVPQNTPQSTEDVITMTAIYGPNSGISKIAYFTVGQEVSDNEKPTISYSADSDCGSLDTSDCQTKIWKVELVLQDKQSGLLQVTSQPKGVRLRSTFVAGTKDLVAAYYSATCCDPSVVVMATDIRGNYAKQTITATPTGELSTAATAGIVTGILLFIIIIIIAAVIVARRRRRQSVSFPQTTES